MSALERFRQWAESNSPFVLNTRAGVQITTEDVEAMLSVAEALEPFVAFFEVYQTLGAPTPKTGLMYSVASRAGERSLTTEHFEAARGALSKARGETE